MKKTATLVSMVDYVLTISNSIDPLGSLIKIYQHAKFQDTPLKLGMFVACSESGEVLDAPDLRLLSTDEKKSLNNAYKQALERVVFPDFHVTYSDRSTVIESPKQKIEIVFYSDRIELNGIIVRLVSDLVDHNIQYYTQ